MNFKNVTSTKFLKEGDVEDEVVEQLKEIDLSTDEEDEDDECEVIIFKRQTITESTVEEVKVMDDNDLAICLEGTELIKAEEKNGYVKEYI